MVINFDRAVTLVQDYTDNISLLHLPPYCPELRALLTMFGQVYLVHNFG